jgi:hypothetical protein
MAQQLSLIVTLENSDDMHTITLRASSTVADAIAIVATAVRARPVAEWCEFSHFSFFSL